MIRILLLLFLLLPTVNEAKNLPEKPFAGKRITLHFENIDLHSILQIFADFTGLNIVVSDQVQGKITLHVDEVPWEEALSVVLRAKGLAKREMNHILFIGPVEEVAQYEKQALQAEEQARNLAPLFSEFIHLRYAKAQALANLLKDEKNSLLSPKGNVSLDDRTNTLLVQDSKEKILEIKTLIQKLDVPVRQVLIESRIVVAHDNFERALDIQFGPPVHLRYQPNVEFAKKPGLSRLNVHLPTNVQEGNAQFGFTIGRLPRGTLLDLELSALESEGLGKIISNPRLVTSNQQKAFIESGEEIPYQESASSGATTIAFKKAVLRLEVEPRITADNRISLDLTVNQDSKGETINNVPAINTQQLHTSVLLEDGETVVLGGIYQQRKQKNISRVPILSRLPLLGWLFRNEYKVESRHELMIFVTPQIIQEVTW